jgi:hypothetical protein
MPSFPNPEDIKKFLGMGPKTPAPRAKIAPLSTEAEKRQAKALKDLMAKRAKEVKRTGNYPNYNTN